MGGDGIEREYRRRRQLSVPWWQLGIDVLVFGAIVVQTATVSPPFPAGRWFNIVILVLIPARGALALLYRRRGRTIVGARGIAARDAVRTVDRAWHDIYDIRAELNTRGVENAEWITYVYDGDGRRTRLPYFDDWQLPDFHAELAGLRAVSAQHRGMDWELRPEVEDRIRRRARDRKVSAAVLVTAMVAAAAAFVVMA
ncbi:PH domain-containing protein [Streptomyces prunicolor]